MLPEPKIISNALELISQQPAELIAIVGPTATGKTDLALALAKQLGLEIINADSRVIYRDMNIGTAKPNALELSAAKHHLVDIKSPLEKYSAAEYQRDFDSTVIARSVATKQSINSDGLLRCARNDQPRAIVVGGTGLYLRAALEDLDMPGIAVDEELRSRIRKQFEAEGLQPLVDELLSMDAEASGLVDLKNHVRVMRALESVILSGKSLAQLRRKLDKHRYDVVYIGLNCNDRDQLYAGIDSRVHKMIELGLEAELRDLLAKYGEAEIFSSTIGYAEMLDYIRGDLTKDQMIASIQQATRNYAKRQITWFKSNKRINWLYK